MWFYRRENQQIGPIFSAELKTLAAKGLLKPADMVLKSGTGQWVPASQVSGLFDEPSAAPAPRRTGVLWLVAGTILLGAVSLGIYLASESEDRRQTAQDNTGQGTLDERPLASTFVSSAPQKAPTAAPTFVPGQASASKLVTGISPQKATDEPNPAQPIAKGPLDKLPLLTQKDLKYLGAFRMPTGTFGATSFAFGGGPLAFNPKNRSLIVGGYGTTVAEVSIPERVVNSSNPKDYPTAKVLQPFVAVLPRIPKKEEHDSLGGLLVADGKLIGTAFGYYDAPAKIVTSHFRFQSLDLTSKLEGLFQVGTLGGGYVGGYMAPIPAEWQAILGAPYLTGQSSLSIITRTSAGPAAFGFDPSKLGPDVTAAIPYVYYPIQHSLGTIDKADPLWNGTTGVRGVLFAPGTRSVIFFGSHGTGKFYYGTPDKCNDPHREGAGMHSWDGKYAYQAWAYDANDFVKVKKGEKRPWEIKPYATWQFDFPVFEGGKYIGGAVYDPATRRLYLSQLRADKVGYDPNPLIQVFEVSPRLTAKK